MGMAAGVGRRNSGEPMMAINWDDPNTQGLMTLAAGLLQNSGWSKTPITLGQAFGQAAPEALNTMQRIKRFNMEAADTDQQRQLRAAQLQKALFENQMDGLLPGQMSMLQRFPGEEVPQADPNIAMREQLLGPFAGGQQGDWADPVVRPFSPAQAPAGQVLPEDAQAISAPQAPASGVPQETLVIGDQAKTLDEMANRMEDRLSMPPNPNNPSVPWHPQAIAAEQRKISGIRARAERIRKEFDRDRTAPKVEMVVSEDGAKERRMQWNPKTGAYDIPLGGWKPISEATKFSQASVPGVTFDKETGSYLMNGKPVTAEELQRIETSLKRAGASNINLGMNPADAAKTELLNQGISDMAEFKSMIMPEGKIDRGIIAQMSIRAPGTDGREAYSLIYNAIEAKLRAESGAAVPEQEVDRMANRFAPSPLDNDKTIVSKMRRLEAFLRGSFARTKNAGEPTTKKEPEKAEVAPKKKTGSAIPGGWSVERVK